MPYRNWNYQDKEQMLLQILWIKTNTSHAHFKLLSLRFLLKQAGFIKITQGKSVVSFFQQNKFMCEMSLCVPGCS